MPRLTVASYNIHACIGRDGYYEPARIAAVINQINPDIIGLQELDTGYRIQNTGMNQLQWLEYLTHLHSVTGPLLWGQKGFYGNAILTKWPIKAVHYHNISVNGYEPRGIVDIELTIARQSVSFMSTHLGLKAGERRIQTDKIIDIMANKPEQLTLLVGDFNDWFHLFSTIGKLNHYMGRFPLVRTFPTALPLFSLDRIWVKPHRALLNLYAYREKIARLASDHLPIIAHITL